MHVGNLEVFSDSQLVAGYVNGNYEARDLTMALYLTEARWLAHLFNCLLVTWVPRAQNTQADALAKSASAHSLEATPTTESIMALTIPSHGVTEIEVSPNWMEEILHFKKDGTKPDDPMVARRLRRTQA